MLLFLIFQPVLLPSLSIHYFAPFLTLSFYEKPLEKVLFRSLACGVLLGLFSTESVFAIHAINLCIVTYLLYERKQNFYEDQWLTLPILSTLYAALSTLTLVLLLNLLEKTVRVSFAWLFVDVFALSICTGIYTLAIMQVPHLMTYLKNRKSQQKKDKLLQRPE